MMIFCSELNFEFRNHPVKDNHSDFVVQINRLRIFNLKKYCYCFPRNTMIFSWKLSLDLDNVEYSFLFLNFLFFSVKSFPHSFVYFLGSFNIISSSDHFSVLQNFIHSRPILTLITIDNHYSFEVFI